MIYVAFIICLIFNIVLMISLNTILSKYESLDNYCKDMEEFYEEKIKELKEEKYDK